MKNTIEPHQELEYAPFTCFHIKFQLHKEIMKEDNQSLESDSKWEQCSGPHCVFWRGPEVSKREICYSLCTFFLVSFEGALLSR